MISSSSGVDALWLETLNRISGRVAHELKGALNGVAVNLEVVRSRATRPEAPASAVATFAESASTQFDAVMDMTVALLALSRAPSGPSDIGRVTRQLAALLAPVAKADGRALVVDGSVDALGVSTADGTPVRLAIAGTMLAAMESATTVTCKGQGGALAIVASDAEVAVPADDVLSAARDAGVGIQAERSAISITFPR